MNGNLRSSILVFKYPSMHSRWKTCGHISSGIMSASPSNTSMQIAQLNFYMFSASLAFLSVLAISSSFSSSSNNCFTIASSFSNCSWVAFQANSASASSFSNSSWVAFQANSASACFAASSFAIYSWAAFSAYAYFASSSFLACPSLIWFIS